MLASASERLAAGARTSLELVADSFRLFPLPGVPRPEPAEWGAFLLEHPVYIDGRQRMAADIIASDRAITEGMSREYQELAGALIRVSFDNQQLEQMGTN